MSTKVASICFMLRHELRLHWRSLGYKMSSGLAAAAILAGLHLFAVPIALIFDELPKLPRTVVLLVTSLALLCALVTMVATGLVAVVKLMYERRDFDLLLSSPMDPQAIVVSRTLGVMAAGVGLAILLVAPFANVFALFGHTGYLALYPVVICVGLLATTLCLLLAEALFRLVGARRARLLSQVVGLAIASALVVAVNLQYLVDNVQQKAIGKLQTAGLAVPPVDSWIWLPARAVLGEGLPLPVLMVIAAGLFLLTTFGLANSFLRNARAAKGEIVVRAKSGHRNVRPFRSGTRRVMRQKELRLLARDPYLVAQIMYQVVAVVPIVFMLWKGSASWPALPWISLVLAAGIIAGNLAWITISAEDSADLLAVAPVNHRDVIRAKLEAALLPVGLLVALPIGVATVLDPWLGLTLLACCAGSALSTALLNLRYAKPARRGDFNKRMQSNWLAGLLEFAIAAVWTGAAALMMLSIYFAALPALFVLAAAGIILRR